ncbi:formimidoylglutamate deiminase [Yinghuangia sp. ASG 101]|uniref:formimidoylglutamate deiminase n=1 Tax=Yinghuangia sp. ASG 101 TaxID=2896848 RepID=UPI001E287429|nr:formimidoylglutamate deiminase [Yinghuangia sp. ASG 101]UGQ14426.1 formimidoylglutamate deiminase [Yinghuangia sp. ASG 101]
MTLQPSGLLWCELVHTRTGVERDVAIDIRDGRIAGIRPDTIPPPGAEIRRGLTVPGFANTHAHAFHRVLRGRTQAGAGTFWTWRAMMYAAADRLDPDTYLALARAVYVEMALAGITTVGEFHYLHHGARGTPYATRNAMGHALVEAARQAGIRITLLDTCYLTGGIGERPHNTQLRFTDGDADRWADRAGALADAYRDADDVLVGAAVHSVRAVPDTQIPVVAAWAADRDVPLHAHVSEQPIENHASFEAYGRTPVEVFDAAGALGPRFTAVHATHVGAHDITVLGRSGAGVCLCPTTERDLADGIGPAGDLARAGVRLSLGTDSQAVTDMFEEARGVELGERLRTGSRGHFTTARLLAHATALGQAALGRDDVGRIETGMRADLVTIGLDSVRLAGTVPRLAPSSAVFAATAADVTHVTVAGRTIVADGTHRLIEDVPGELTAAIRALVA